MSYKFVDNNTGTMKIPTHWIVHLVVLVVLVIIPPSKGCGAGPPCEPGYKCTTPRPGWRGLNTCVKIKDEKSEEWSRQTLSIDNLSANKVGQWKFSISIYFSSFPVRWSIHLSYGVLHWKGYKRSRASQCKCIWWMTTSAWNNEGIYSLFGTFGRNGDDDNDSSLRRIFI